MKIYSNHSLKDLNTFGVEAKANKLVTVFTINDILFTLSAYAGPFKVLGGGSNVIFAGNIKDVMIKNEIKGVEVIDEDESLCMVKVGAGENWHNFVMWSVYHNLGGLENLALIPGTVGAAPIQNIGAYGVEQETYFHSATVIDLESGLVKTFYKDDCKFGYRDSIFKSYAKDQYIVCDVTYVLQKDHTPVISYKDIEQKLAINSIDNPTIKQVADIVIDVRQNKLPDPAKIGNAGSFFKNPVVSVEKLTDLKSDFEDIVNYPVGDVKAKLSAAWMIDQCGYKGYRKGDAGTYKNQALVLVNHGNATSEDILNLAVEIQSAVYNRYGVELIPEVNIWG